MICSQLQKSQKSRAPDVGTKGNLRGQQGLARPFCACVPFSAEPHDAHAQQSPGSPVMGSIAWAGLSHL